MEPGLLILSLVVFLPAVAALAVVLFPRGSDDQVKLFSLAVTVVVFAITVWMALPGDGTSAQFVQGQAEMQNHSARSWIQAFGIEYRLGVDGISFPLVLLTTSLSVLAMGASWPINRHVKGYCILFLLLETGMLGVFVALDFFLFFVFWEVMLLPMYFLIGIWGGPRREYAAVKFFLYTMLGGVCIVVALLMLYFNSDLKKLSPEQLRLAGVSDQATLESIQRANAAIAQHEADARAASAAGDADKVKQATNAARAIDSQKLHTFNILALQQMGQHTRLFNDSKDPLWLGKSIQWWAFVLLFIGFAIKVPSWPFHTWLPDAHVEAPTPISMILAGVLLKMGGYGLIRVAYPICPEAAYDLAYVVCAIGVISMIYGAFAALAQRDFKRLVAYSSVSHMGYVVLGIGIAGAVSANGYSADFWKQGMNGAMYQMLAHGVSSAGMFFMVGVLYERVHHRDLNRFGGLFAKMPVYCGLAWVIFLASVGLPGLCGFPGEAFVVLSAWSFNKTLAILAAATVILTAGYILWAFQRVYLGAEYKGPHEEELLPETWRERAIAIPLVVAAFVLGVAPNHTVLPYVAPSVNKTVTELVEWRKAEDQRASATKSVATTAVASVHPAP
jgi:NADH-quinone oxidoreductase subunit M